MVLADLLEAKEFTEFLFDFIQKLLFNRAIY